MPVEFKVKYYTPNYATIPDPSLPITSNKLL